LLATLVVVPVHARVRARGRVPRWAGPIGAGAGLLEALLLGRARWDWVGWNLRCG
jgi:hypothetical protein